jgi:hypothetical protein
VRDKLAIDFEDMGEQQLKNIARPVRVYRVPIGGLPIEIAVGRGALQHQSSELGCGFETDSAKRPARALASPSGMIWPVIPFTTVS